MRRREQFMWISAMVLCLAPFAFFAGLGMRGLYRSFATERLDTGAGDGLTRLASANPRVPDTDTRPQFLYMDVLNKLKLWSVEGVPNDTRLAHGSVEAMLNSLDDPNTRLVSPTEAKALRDATLGQFHGLGAVLTIQRYNERAVAETAKANLPGVLGTKPKPENPGIKTVTVVSVLPGSPAETAGLQAGDRITEIDGHWVAPTHVSYRILTQIIDPAGIQDGRPRSPEELPEQPITPDPDREKFRKEQEEVSKRWQTATDLSTALTDLNGGMQGEHEITFQRGVPAKTQKVKVTFGVTRPELVSSRKINETTGYLRVLLFNPETVKQAGEALGKLQADGAKSLVVDLRGNPGGSMDAARQFAGLLIGNGKFMVVKERDAARALTERVVTAQGPAKFKPATLSVLVDRGTAGSAELVAAALRDNLGTPLVGGSTFGDGTEQELAILQDGSGISITRARTLTAKRLDFDGKGLRVDVPATGDPVEDAVKALAAPAPAAPASAVKGARNSGA